MMRLIVMVTILIWCFTGTNAGTVFLSGYVVEKGTESGIANATITLRNNSGQTSTGTDGSFTINSAHTTIAMVTMASTKPFTLSNKTLRFAALAQNISAKIELFTGNGRRIAAFRTASLNKSEQRIVLPDLASGITLVRITIGNNVYTGSLYSFDGIISMRCRDGDNISATGSSIAMQATANTIDTIVASKPGYITQYYPLNSYSQENITIEMEKYSDYTDISLLTTSIEVTGSGATADGTEVTITAAGIYSIHGTLTDGRIVVSTEDTEDIILILDNVAISNTSTAPLFIEKAGNTVIELADGSNNIFSDASTYTWFHDGDEPNATIFSKDELVICGNGNLKVESNYKDGITCKDGLTITGGTFTIDAVDDGIRGKDKLVIQGGTFTITTGGDGLKSNDSGDVTTGIVAIVNGTFAIIAGRDGIQASNSVVITGGVFDITTGGGSENGAGHSGDMRPGTTVISSESDTSSKGIKALTDIHIDGGTFTIDAADDAIHSNGTITLHDGVFTIATGDDGIHADSVLTMDGGTINITKSYEGFESLRITLNAGTATIVSSDDGMNVAGGNDGSGMGGSRPGDWSPTITTGSSDMLLQINGGFFAVYAGGDGLDANGSIEINGGTTLVHGPVSGANGVFDIGDGGGYTFTINGGFVLGAGTSSMAIAPENNSAQNCLVVYLSQNAGTLINLTNSTGENLLTFSPATNYGYVVFSSPDLVNGTYTFYYGGSVSGGTENGGLYDHETYTPGTVLSEISVSSRITRIGTGGSGDFRP